VEHADVQEDKNRTVITYP